MIDLNSYNVIGRLTRDPELGYIPGNNTALCKFSIAVSDRRGNNDVVSYFEVQVWGKQAEMVKKYVLKGYRVGIQGKLIQDRWQDKNNQNRSKVIINAASVQFLEPKKDNNQGGYQQNNSNNYQNNNQNNQRQQQPPADPFKNGAPENNSPPPDPFQSNNNSNHDPFQNNNSFENIDFNNSDNEEIPF